MGGVKRGISLVLDGERSPAQQTGNRCARGDHAHSLSVSMCIYSGPPLQTTPGAKA
jgi:hypothetical protein